MSSAKLHRTAWGTIRSAMFGLAAIAALGLSSFALSTPAAAQMRSEGYKFLQAVEKRERNEAIEMVQKPGSTVVNARDITSGRSAMHIAVARRDMEWVELLRGLKADPDIADNRGVTPLMLAVQQGWVEGLRELLKGRVRVDASNSAGETPLIFAVHRKDTQMMRVLLGAGANPDRADNSGRTARDYARLAGGTLLDEIERNAKTGNRQGGEVYGPR